MVVGFQTNADGWKAGELTCCVCRFCVYDVEKETVRVMAK